MTSGISLPNELLMRLRVMAAERGTSMAALIRQATEETGGRGTAAGAQALTMSAAKDMADPPPSLARHRRWVRGRPLWASSERGALRGSGPPTKGDRAKGPEPRVGDRRTRTLA